MTLFLAVDNGPAAQIVEAFGLNWWGFISQCISFALVAFLLQRFAYKPILVVLEERRLKIAEGLESATQIRAQLADAQRAAADLLAKAGADSQTMIFEARAAAKALADRQAQQAIAEAEQIVVKARQATVLEREAAMTDLRREVVRLVVATTAKVVGKVLTAEDQRRLSEEASKEIASEFASSNSFAS